MLRSADVKHMGKSGKQTLSMMKKLMTHVGRAATDIANRSDLIVKERGWTKTDCSKLYRAVKHFFQFPDEKGKRKRRYETISWKTYYNLCMKRKWRLYGEKEGESATDAVAQPAAATVPRPPPPARRPVATVPRPPPPARAPVAPTNSRKEKSQPKRRRNTSTRSNEKRLSTSRKRRRQTFAAAFSGERITRQLQQAANSFAYGNRCMAITDPEQHGTAMRTYVCHARDCDTRVHHTCSWKLGLAGHNEVNEYCTKRCKDSTGGA
mmetsp:Transcript_36019/g.87029  ORF Transcript_36019/g.87029 Transcript_36019/m.87029 type:complete len:265 (-) Transcript_36019:96-890(-)